MSNAQEEIKRLNEENDKLRFIINNLKPNNCILCGARENITKHHLSFKRKKIFINECATRGTLYVPLCKDCHEKVELLKTSLKLKKS